MEITAIFPQTVAAGQNVLFSETPVFGSRFIDHRDGSGIVTLRGAGPQARARYKVIFGANVAIPAGGTVGPITVAISLAGEALGSATAIFTPAAVGDLGNVSAFVYVDVPCGCCRNVAVTNLTAAPIAVQNANLIVERVA